MKNNSAREHEIISSSSSSSESAVEDREVVVMENLPPTWGTASSSSSISGGRKRLLTKQLSMWETTREAKWEKQRQQILHRRKMMEGEGDKESSRVNCSGGRLSTRVRSLTDEDWDELIGSIELGFGFNEEDGGHHPRDMLPALDLYFAVNRQLSNPKLRFSPSPSSTPTATSLESMLCGSSDPSNPLEHHGHHSFHSSPGEYWKICNLGIIMNSFPYRGLVGKMVEERGIDAAALCAELACSLSLSGSQTFQNASPFSFYQASKYLHPCWSPSPPSSPPALA